MSGQARSKANTPEWTKNYDKVDWKGGNTRPSKHRAVKVHRDGTIDCGIKSHTHDTFAQAAACVTGKGAK